MLMIRSLTLDGAALVGIVVGVAAGVGGYLHGATATSASASCAVDGLDTTGTIALKAAVMKPDAWADPPYRRSRW